MALVGEADLVPQNAGHQTAYGVGDHHCRKLAAGQNKVAQEISSSTHSSIKRWSMPS